MNTIINFIVRIFITLFILKISMTMNLIYADTLNSDFMLNKKIAPITDFQINSYLGKWYEIARLDNRFERKCIAPITATYSVSYINMESNQATLPRLIVQNECDTLNARHTIAFGEAEFASTNNVGKLMVTFAPKFLRFLPFVYGDYIILHTDYKSFSIVVSDNRKYLWILSRTPNIKFETLKKIIDEIELYGFNINELIFN